MKYKLHFKTIVLLIASTVLFACGGNSGGNDSPSAPTKMIVTFFTEGTLPANVHIGTIDISVTLPEGITIKGAVSQNPPVMNVDTSTYTITGVAVNTAIVTPTYTPATSTAQGKLQVTVLSMLGLEVGEFISLSSDITAGTTLKVEDIQVLNAKVTDTRGNSITNIAVKYSTSLQ